MLQLRRTNHRLSALRAACGLLSRCGCVAEDHGLALKVLRGLAQQEAKHLQHKNGNTPQLALWIRMLETFEMPWRVSVLYEFPCLPLHCNMRAGECVRRQMASEQQRTEDAERGQSSDYPTCNAKCIEGAAIRARLDPAANVKWERGSGHVGRDRFRIQQDVAIQYQALDLQRRSGLLEDVPTLDSQFDDIDP